MRITLLGHASILVEMAGATCLMDPVFWDPFEEGAVVSCPQRIVNVEQLPPIDILIISHRHPDHFDLRSLARVPRTCQVFCPPDPLITYALDQLGFKQVAAVPVLQPISSPDFQLFPTKSENPLVREFGMLFHDGSGTFWNQVDAPLSAGTIRTARSRYGVVDVLFAMYASQNFEFFESRTNEFPYEEHRRNLESVLAIQPRVVVPASAGFKFCGDHAWLNRFLFPVSRARFVADLKVLDPSLRSVIINPGDVLEIEAGDVQLQPAASPVAQMIQDDTDEIRFDPTASIPPLGDPNPDGYEEEDMERMIAQFIERGVYEFAKAKADEPLSIPFKYKLCQAVYGIEVVYPTRSSCWEIDFRGDDVLLSRRDGLGEANVVHRIAASALSGWIQRKKSFFSIRAYSRRFSTWYRVSGDAAGVHLNPLSLPDLLMHYVLEVAEGAEEAARRRVDLELAQLDSS